MIKSQSAGGIVLNKYAEIVIVSQMGLSWSLPKGHCEKAEDLLSTAFREIREETGLKQLQFIQKCGHYTRFKIGKDKNDDKSEEKEIHIYLFSTSELYLEPEDSDNPHAKWVVPCDVSNWLTHEKDKVFIQSQLPIINYYQNQLLEIKTSVGTEPDAEKLASYLIDNKLAACVQIVGPSKSIYRWKNAINIDNEFYLTIKTLRKKLKVCEEAIKNIHPYDCPELIANAFECVDAEFHSWALNAISNKYN